jgi:hypothetical protein
MKKKKKKRKRKRKRESLCCTSHQKPSVRANTRPAKGGGNADTAC